MTNSISSLFSSSEVSLLVSQLETRLDAPITVEQNEIKTDQAQISALGAVRGALTSLSGALSGIADPSSINAMNAAVSNSDATASAAPSAASGSYSLSNIVLAKPQELLSVLFASGSAKLGTGSGALSFTFAGGGSAKVAIASGSANPNDVARAINGANIGIQASVITSASGAYLSLTGAETGADQAFGVSGTGSLAGLHYAAGSGSPTMSVGEAARNASFTLNGAAIVEPKNSGLAVMKGLTISLVASGSATIKVAASSQALSSVLSKFTSQFNNALSVLAKQTEYKAAATSSGSASGKATVGPLLGDVGVEQLSQDLLSTVAGAAEGGLAAASIGLSVGSAGSLTFSSAALASAYAKNPMAVNMLVQQIEQGVSAVVAGAVGGTNGTPGGAGGFVGAETKDLQTSVTSIGQQVSAQQKLAAEQVADLEHAFTVVEAQFGSASTTLDYLGAILGAGSSGGQNNGG